MILKLGGMLHIVILTLYLNYKKKEIIRIITFSDHNAHTVGMSSNRGVFDLPF